MTLKKRVCCALLAWTMLILLMPSSIASISAASQSVTALFDSYETLGGSFTLHTDARIFAVSDEKPAGMLLSTIQLANSRMAAFGLPSDTVLSLAYGSQEQIRAGDIVLRRDDFLPDEGYRIEIDDNNITIYYTTGAEQSFYDGEGSCNSLLYAFHALMRLADGNTFGCCSFSDAPDTSERTVQLDIGRKYWSMTWIKNLIDEMSWMGYNALDLHLTEDQGCRANIWRDAAGNTVTDCNGNDFSWMIGYHPVSWNSSYTDPNADQFYTRDDLIELVEYAKSRHIEIIPAVDYPTHADCLIAKFKTNFVNTGTDFTFRFGGTTYSGHRTLQAGNNATVNVADDYARNLTFAIADAYADFFGSFGCSKFNIGGDEVSGASYSWATSDFNLSGGGSSDNYKDAYVLYMNALAAVVQREVYGADAHGYTVRAWNDCLFGTGYYYYDEDGRQRHDYEAATVAVDPTIEVCFWTASTDHDAPATLAAQGRTVYNCVNWYTYYVLRNNATYGDARDDDCTQWTFNHASAERIFSGCGGSCAYACRHIGGWCPADFNGCDSGCFNDQYVTGDCLGGGYFLIWGDWAGWDSEESIWNRTDGYGLLDRMWSNAIKQWDWNADESLTYAELMDVIAQWSSVPGFLDCTAAAELPTADEFGALTVEVKLRRSTTVQLVETISVEIEAGESYRVRIPTYIGCNCVSADGGRLVLCPLRESMWVLRGTATTDRETVTVWLQETLPAVLRPITIPPER